MNNNQRKALAAYGGDYYPDVIEALQRQDVRTLACDDCEGAATCPICVGVGFRVNDEAWFWETVSEIASGVEGEIVITSDSSNEDTLRVTVREKLGSRRVENSLGGDFSHLTDLTVEAFLRGRGETQTADLLKARREAGWSAKKRD